MKRIFRERYKLLAALFPTNGEVLVNRACAVACSVVNTEALEKAAVDTIVEKVIACHHLGLEIGDQAYLVPFKGQTNLIVGPRGIVALMYRSGFVRAVTNDVVYRADTEPGAGGSFSYNQATNDISHVKATRGRYAGGSPEQLITHSYAVIDTTTGGRCVKVLTAEDIAYYRAFSKANRGPWFDNYPGMARKTALKRVSEGIPRSPLMAAALKENEVGGYEIPDEMWEAAKQRAEGRAVEQVPADLMPEQTDAQRAAAVDQAREPGSDG